MFKKMKLRGKLMIVGCLLTIVPLIVVGVFVFVENRVLMEVSEAETRKQAYGNIESIADLTYNLIESQHESLQKSVESQLNVARKIVVDQGGISFAEETVTWNAINQYTKNVSTVRVPKMLVGNTWVGQTTDMRTNVPVVDEVQSLSGGMTCTIFQRINSAGDMLRVATNVIKKDGTRAVGTYISYINPDGKPNPIISTVLRGQTFSGMAYVVDEWYISAYEPIYDVAQKIVGVLYVGIPMDTNKMLRQAILETKVGNTGYVWILDSKGTYIISKDGLRDGEDIWGAKDSQGNLFIQEMVRKALALSPGKSDEHRYPWVNIGETEARMKYAKLKYFKSWDWVIGVGLYEDELLESADKVKQINGRINVILFSVLAVSFSVAILAWFFTSKGISGPIVNIAGIIQKIAKERDFTLNVQAKTKDEIGNMAEGFNNLLHELREAFKVVGASAEDVESHSDDVSKRAGANRERAVNEQKQIEQIQSTVSEMAVTAGEVADHSNAQRDAAKTAREHVGGMVKSMDDMSESSKAQVEEARNANERVEAMGETGGQVVATAGKQGEAVVEVTAAVDKIEKAVEEMTEEATKSMEYGKQVLQAANDGAVSVNATVEGMRAIAESSDQISEIISVITEIAEQTNLLSLNAAIEAARAGIHGKGFAVVADEVGKLAQRSSEAAKEITQLIKDSTSSVAEGTKLTDESQLALEKIAEGGKVNMDAIEEISKTTEMLAAGTREVHKMVEELNTLAQEIGGMAGQQGERRAAAQKALSVLIEEAESISSLVESATGTAHNVGEEMEGIEKRTEEMETLTATQAERSKKLNEITDESAEGAKQTVEGAGRVVDITKEMQELSHALTQQVEQFKIEADTGRSV